MRSSWGQNNFISCLKPHLIHQLMVKLLIALHSNMNIYILVPSWIKESIQYVCCPLTLTTAVIKLAFDILEKQVILQHDQIFHTHSTFAYFMQVSFTVVGIFIRTTIPIMSKSDWRPPTIITPTNIIAAFLKLLLEILYNITPSHYRKEIYIDGKI